MRVRKKGEFFSIGGYRLELIIKIWQFQITFFEIEEECLNGNLFFPSHAYKISTAHMFGERECRCRNRFQGSI